jgi:Fic family protein
VSVATIACNLAGFAPAEETLWLYRRLQDKRPALNALRPLSPEQAADLKRLLDLDLTYNSNAIEGSTLSYAETRLILEQGLTIAGKPLREHLEAINHKEAIDLIEDLARERTGPVGERDLLAIHGLILRGIDRENAGRYCRVPVGVRQGDGELRHFCDPLQVPDAMRAFADWLAKEPEPDGNQAIQKASEAHLHLVSIHPFVDGNGRTARLLMILLLIRADYPPAVILAKRRLQYIDSLEIAQSTGDRNPFLALVGAAVEEGLDLYLDTLRNGTRYV